MMYTRKQARFFAAETLHACAASGYILPVKWTMSTGKLADLIYRYPHDYNDMLWHAANQMIANRNTRDFRRFDELYRLSNDPDSINLIIELYGMPTVYTSVIDNYDPAFGGWKLN